ncbi:MAG: hypothetical protein WCH52_03315 [Bacteroidota bacterium]
MDMLFFPYNDMFSNITKSTIKPSTFYLKVNGEKVPFTTNLYWKKDFMEQAPNKYATYIKANQQNYLAFFLDVKIKDKNISHSLINRLTPHRVDFPFWAAGYLAFAGMPVIKESKIELCQYNYSFNNQTAVLEDSIILLTGIIQK